MKIAVVITVLLLAIVSGGVFMLSSDAVRNMSFLQREPERIDVRFERVEPRELTQLVSAPGEVEPHTKVDISAQIAARIEALPFREGQEVQRGDVVVRLDDRDLAAALESARARRDGERFRLQSEMARLTSLRSSLELAKKTLERQQSLHETRDVPQAILDEALQRVDDLEAQINAATHQISQAESSIAAADADIRRAEEGLRNTIITSPITGRVTKLNAEVGELVVTGTMNNPGTVIMTIADLSRMLMIARVAESDVAAVEPGQPARIYINAYPDIVFDGDVRQVALQRTGNADGTGYFETEIEIKLDGRRIYAGLMANADIEIATHRGLIVPSQAVVDRDMDELPADVLEMPQVDRTKRTVRLVFRVIDGKAIATPVRIGPSDLTHTLITDGLTEGDLVIIGPYKALDTLEHEALVKDMDAPKEDTEKATVDDSDAAPAPQRVTQSRGAESLLADGAGSLGEADIVNTSSCESL